MKTDDSLLRLSNEDIIEHIHDTRNELVGKLMHEDHLKTFLKDHFSVEVNSRIKIEFIRRSLKELAGLPVDLSHYAQLILEIRKSGSMVVSKVSERYFVNDIERTLKGYL